MSDNKQERREELERFLQTLEPDFRAYREREQQNAKEIAVMKEVQRQQGETQKTQGDAITELAKGIGALAKGQEVLAKGQEENTAAVVKVVDRLDEMIERRKPIDGAIAFFTGLGRFVKSYTFVGLLASGYVVYGFATGNWNIALAFFG